MWLPCTEYPGKLMVFLFLWLLLYWHLINPFFLTVFVVDFSTSWFGNMFQITCAVLSDRGLDILWSTVCLREFVYPVARRHIVLLASLHVASSVMVLMVPILETARGFRWRGKSRLWPQIKCHSWRLGIVTRRSTESIFHAFSFELWSSPIVPPPLLGLHDLLAVVFFARFL